MTRRESAKGFAFSLLGIQTVNTQVTARKCETSDPAALESLCTRASGRSTQPGYAGEVEPQEAWEILQHHPEALLIDVRTPQEWQSVGLPVLEGIAGKLVTLSWRQGPGYTINPNFAEQLRNAGATYDTPLFFLCRTGGRSLDAAIAMTAQGYHFCFNMHKGFEGEPDDQGLRGTRNGWKASQLPWRQG